MKRLIYIFFLLAFAQLASGQTSKLSGLTFSGNSAQYLDGTGAFTTPSGGTTYFTWNTSASTAISATVNNAYVLTHTALQTVTLPTTAAVGDRIKLVGVGTGKWKVAQNASELIRFGNGLVTTTGTGGYLQSQEQNACIELVCIVADNEWQVESSSGCIYTDGSVDIHPSSKFTQFTASGTWTKDARTKFVDVIAFGSGGGGASGRKGAAGSNRGGGGGGSGGQVAIYNKIPSTYLSATETVTIAASASGGISQTTNSTDGVLGSNGTSSSLGSIVLARGGNRGSVGTTSGGNGGAARISYNLIGASAGAGGNGGTTGGSTPTLPVFVSAGGGGGGGISSANTRGNGGDGAAVINAASVNILVGGTNGAADGASGGNGNDATSVDDVIIGGSGGGGGAASLLTNAGTGGNGGIPGGGGGGGGASVDAVGNSGAGGDGARGEIWVFEYF